MDGVGLSYSAGGPYPGVEMKFVVIVVAACLVLGGWAIHPGLGILVAMLSYGVVESLLSK